MLNLLVNHTTRTLFQVLDSELDNSDTNLVVSYYNLLISYPGFVHYKLQSERTPMDTNPPAVWESLPNLFPSRG